MPKPAVVMLWKLYSTTPAAGGARRRAEPVTACRARCGGKHLADLWWAVAMAASLCGDARQCVPSSARSSWTYCMCWAAADPSELGRLWMQAAHSSWLLLKGGSQAACSLWLTVSVADMQGPQITSGRWKRCTQAHHGISSVSKLTGSSLMLATGASSSNLRRPISASITCKAG